MTASGLTLVVTERRPLAEGVMGFSLARPDGSPLPEYSAGSHIEVEVEGIGPRRYSLTGADRTHYDIAVALDEAGRGGSIAIHRQWREGTIVSAAMPRNNFPTGNAREAILLAGGIGITPIVALRRAFSASDRATRTHYAARSRQRLAFIDELSSDAAHPVTFHVDGENPLDVCGVIAAAPRDADIYACGPATMLEAIEKAVLERPDLTLHSERFSAGGPTACGEAFEITLASDGRRFVVGDQATILDTLRAHGCDPDTSCEGGVCGTCRTAVISGEIEHHDYFLSDAEKAAGDSILICVSRGKPGTNLVLDL